LEYKWLPATDEGGVGEGGLGHGYDHAQPSEFLQLHISRFEWKVNQAGAFAKLDS
jgi:hypothetical protein